MLESEPSGNKCFLGQSQKDMKVYWHWKEDHLEVFGCIWQERLFEVANHLPRDQQSGQKLEQKNQFELFEAKS